MSDDRWPDFWRAHGRDTANADAQTQVLRTFNKQPIDQRRWAFTLAELDRSFPIGVDDDVLDLCCGNGLFTAHFAPRCKSVTSVDISPDLLAALDQRALPNVRTHCADMRAADFPDGSFSRILLYAAVQYIEHGECVALFQRMARWLRPGGALFVGDIPDSARLWRFYNTPERRKLYFENLRHGRDVVGTWFSAEWMEQLCLATGFSAAAMVPQHPDLIYAHFRFDLVATR